MSGPGVFPTFLYYFAFTYLVVAIVLKKGVTEPLPTDITYAISLISSISAGALGAYVNRTIQVSIPLEPTTQTKLSTLLEAMGYRPISNANSESDSKRTEASDCIIYERPGLSKLFSSKVFIQTTGTVATIAGRASMIKRLTSQLI
ncbi:MAG: hypothetical protein NZ772_16695 [Cyanobacteria bacterium]|nr:hypothetical protein [Cyanobacteriota bacterium]MDW8202973.1 hypothetical protein [Cyanobacteriota bacterium SKYGB_h_bin112]